MEEIYNKWLEMIEEDEKRDGISMLEPQCWALVLVWKNRSIIKNRLPLGPHLAFH